MQRAVVFESGAERLCGVLYLPEDAGRRPPDLGVVFVHSGSRGRLGNTFHYPFLARQFARRGVASLSFDPAGLGDSTGAVATCNQQDFYGSIQSGRYVGDTLAAVDELHRQVRPKRIVLFGICGGAITALLAGPRSLHVDGLILLSVPVLMDSAQQDLMSRIPRGYARRYLASLYARKLLSPAAWLRLLTMKSDVRDIARWVWTALRGAEERATVRRAVDAPPVNSRFNRNFVESLDAVVARGARVLFCFGSNDYFWTEFEREFKHVYWDRNPGYARACEVHTVASCNHMFTVRKWQQEAFEIATDWLGRLR
jgi:pimeloyl-ACP methyl ester carboxylesterase